jgi:glycogen(starch) synthase
VRIALLPSAYFPAVGGVEQLTRRLAAHLRAAGDHVEVWTMRHPDDLPPLEEVDGVTVRRFAFALPAANAAALLNLPVRGSTALRGLHGAARRFRPDVLHVQCFGPNGPYGLALATLRGTPIVVTLQGETIMDDHDVFDRSVTQRAALRLALRGASAVTACSRFVLDDAIRRFGTPRGPHHVLPNGVDLTEEDEEAVDIRAGRFVLALGRVVHKKGFDLLLRAFARLPEDLRDVRLVVAGDGPQRVALQELALALGLGERVAFPGAVARPQVAWLMKRTDAFVLPSRVEPFGIVTLEAMRFGRPVVVSSHGGSQEIVRTPDEGLVVDPTDEEALACALTTLLRDGALRTRLGDAGRRRAHDFAWPAIAAEYRTIYAGVVAGRHTRAAPEA